VVWAYTKPVFAPVPRGAAAGGDPPVAESTESEEAS
jgi:hypothetical protein